MGKVNDRGTIKWTSIMMPEHIKLLDDMWKEKEYKKKPILDEQQKIEFDMMFQLAIKDDLTIQIEYFENHDFHTTKGKLTTINSMNGYLQLENMEKISLNDIINVQIL